VAREQEDPCKVKSRVVADATYCDRYWECVNGQPELYDCPNGLVFAGKHRGVTEGCDYPWRSNYCEGKQLASTINQSHGSLDLTCSLCPCGTDTAGIFLAAVCLSHRSFCYDDALALPLTDLVTLTLH